MKKLGFGCMRLPMINKETEQIDYPHFIKMIDTYLANGFTYFDTAYMYHNYQSEIAVRECLVKRYPRERYYLADKLPLTHLKKEEDLEKIFNEQLEKTGVKYFDYYLLHNINENTYPVLEKFPCFDFLLKLKNEKKVKKIGFSFHGSPEMLEQVLHDYPFVDFVQLQINYLDWESKVIQAKKCYEIAANKYNKDIIVMETIKGGYLANLQKDIAKTLLEYNPNMSLASWAVRYVASLPKVIIALSGMSSLEQLKDNLSYMKDFVPLNNIELQLIQKVVEQLNSLTYIPCTACNYCKEGCPKKIAIPEYFSLYNSYKQKTIDNFSSQSVYYHNLIANHGKASDCIKCKKCEKSCPQHINITKYLEEVAKTFE